MTIDDRQVDLCVAPGFLLHDASEHGGYLSLGNPPDSAYATFFADILDSSEAALDWGTDPPTRGFRSSAPDLPDGIIVDSVAVEREHIDQSDVDVETALVSGGFIGFERSPQLRAVWPLSGGRWMLVQGRAQTRAALEVQRAMLRTIHVR